MSVCLWLLPTYDYHMLCHQLHTSLVQKHIIKVMAICMYIEYPYISKTSGDNYAFQPNLTYKIVLNVF